MGMKNFFPRFRDEGQEIAGFGTARLVKFLDGKYELSGGSDEDRTEAKEWISLFCHEIVLSDGSGIPGARSHAMGRPHSARHAA
jgi:hypothetical protein